MCNKSDDSFRSLFDFLLEEVNKAIQSLILYRCRNEKMLMWLQNKKVCGRVGYSFNSMGLFRAWSKLAFLWVRRQIFTV